MRAVRLHPIIGSECHKSRPIIHRAGIRRREYPIRHIRHMRRSCQQSFAHPWTDGLIPCTAKERHDVRREAAFLLYAARPLVAKKGCLVRFFFGNPCFLRRTLRAQKHRIITKFPRPELCRREFRLSLSASFIPFLIDAARCERSTLGAACKDEVRHPGGDLCCREVDRRQSRSTLEIQRHSGDLFRKTRLEYREAADISARAHRIPAKHQIRKC